MAEIKKLISIKEYEDFINGEGTLNILKASANWCAPCRVLGGKIQELKPEEVEGVLFAEADVDEEWFEDKAAELKIRGIPVLIVFKDGEIIDRNQGAMTKEMLLDFIEKNKQC